MPIRERVAAFVDVVVSGDHVRAIEDYYDLNATMQENSNPPRVGREALIAHERASAARFRSMHTHPAKIVLVDGDNVVINWIFDVTDHSGVVRRLDEVALQRWHGDRIIEERFFYDTASAWRPVGHDEAERGS